MMRWLYSTSTPPTTTQPYFYDHHFGYGMMGHGFGYSGLGWLGFVFGGLFMLILLAIGILVVIWLWKQVNKK